MSGLGGLAYRVASIVASVSSLFAGANGRVAEAALLVVGALVMLLAAEVAYPTESRRRRERRLLDEAVTAARLASGTLTVGRIRDRCTCECHECCIPLWACCDECEDDHE